MGHICCPNPGQCCFPRPHAKLSISIETPPASSGSSITVHPLQYLQHTVHPPPARIQLLLPSRSPIPCMLDSSSYARLSQASQARLERFMQRPRCSPTRRGMHSFFPRASTLIQTHPHSSSCLVVVPVGLRLRLQDISHCAQLACRGNPSTASAFWRRRRESESFPSAAGR